MMEEMNLDEFDNWLKKKADKHRMYPSDGLWRNINQQIHGQSRWPALTFSAILTGALVTAALIFLHPQKDALTYKIQPDNTGNAIAAVTATTGTAFTKAKAPANAALKPVDTKKALYSFNYTVDEPAETEIETAKANLVAKTDEIQRDNLNTLNLVQKSATLPATLSTPHTTIIVNEADASAPVLNKQKQAIMLHASVLTESPDAGVTDTLVVNAAATALAKIDSAKTDLAEEVVEINTLSNKTIVLPGRKKQRWGIEVYGGPNVNYRRLNEPRSYNYHQPYNPSLASSNRNTVNNVVRHLPSVGFNFGTAFTYAISNRIKVRSGLQFNFRQYTINAYQSQFERSVLLLNNGFYYPDSVFTYSVISNDQGSKALTLNNRYYQIGIPIGVDWTVAKLSPKVSLNFSASFQPTYQLNSNVYLITSDYKSYVQAPGLTRRININAGAEATVNIAAGGVQWQVGPQVLYQTLPTQKSSYSIREHLFDYGVRIGIAKQIR